MSTNRSVRESELYYQQLQEFGDLKYLDEVLESLIWAISTKAEEFPVLPNTTLRRARTMEFERNGLTIIPLKIWFTILDENTVLLLSISQDYFQYDENEDDFPF